MLKLVRCDINNLIKLFEKKNSRRFFKNLRLMICLNHSSQEIYILQIKVKSQTKKASLNCWFNREFNE